MKIGIPREVHPDEQLVAATPETAQRLQKLGFEIFIESDAGIRADLPDSSYEAVGCKIVKDPVSLWSSVDIVLKVRPPQMHPKAGKHEAELIRKGATLISFAWPRQDSSKAWIQQLSGRGASLIAMDEIPRITRAQKMDARSSLANISGYRAVIEAAQHFGRFFTGQITAAGKVAPARVLVIGAGVAGLAAIGAARGLGAIVRAFDTRPAVREQIESMGAEFLTIDIVEDGDGGGGYAKTMSKEFMDAERALFEEQAKDVDIIITTALIPGKPAPDLVTSQAIKNLKHGSVLVDLAAEQGGNCKLIQPGEIRQEHGVTLIGYTNLPGRMANVASFLYGNNLAHLLDDMGGGEKYRIDEDDEVVRGALVLREGEMKWPPPVRPAEPSPPAKSNLKQNKIETSTSPQAKLGATVDSPKPSAADNKASASSKTEKSSSWPLILSGAALLLVGTSGDDAFLAHFTVFVLACFVGYQVIWNVAPALHTPLMSVTNAISGIIIVGGMMQIGGDTMSPATLLGLAAIFVATINIAGGFLVTQRMLKMFHR